MSPTNFDVYPISTLFFKSHSPQRKEPLPYPTPIPKTPSAERLIGCLRCCLEHTNISPAHSYLTHLGAQQRNLC